MKKMVSALLLLSLIAAVSVSAEEVSPAAEPSKKDVSYAFGILIGNSLQSTSVDIDYDQFLKGVKDSAAKKATLTLEQAQEKAQAAMQAASARKASANQAAEKTFLAQNGKKPGVKTTASGLQYIVVKEGTGAKPAATDTVRAHYVGKLLDGTVFDSSRDRGEPATFPLDRVIPGWTEGLQLMKVGATYQFFIPSTLGYGEEGAGNVIPGNSTLVFEVELLGIEPPQAEEGPAK